MPGAHSAQVVCPWAAPYAPQGHGRHCAELEAPTNAENEPAGHASHEVAEAALEKRPAPHVVQAEEPEAPE